MFQVRRQERKPLRHPGLGNPALGGPLLALALLAAACAPRAQTPSITTWPEELRIRGAVLVVGENVEPEGLRARFLELAGGDEARVVELDVGTAPPAPQLAALAGATGVWLSESSRPGDDGGATFDDRTVAALRGVVDRGGVIAADGGAIDALGLIPGVVLQLAYDAGRDRAGLLATLEANPRLLGVGLPADAALELDGRRLRALAGDVTLVVPAGGERPAREAHLTAGAEGRSNQADLTAWRREAIERTLPPFPEADPRPPYVERGTLVIVGGGSIPAEITELFVETAGGAGARLVFVPPEEGDELSSEPSIVRGWRDAGVAGADWIHTKDRLRADGDPSFLAPLREATGIWFGGGRQWNFSDSYFGTETHRLMREVLQRGGVIGGTSAGASIQAEWMARGDPLGNQNIIAPGYERGLGFITGVAIDQHFTQRNRAPDMEEAMATYPQLLGIGLDEGTAIVVRGSVAEVMGDGGVHFYDRRDDPESPPVVLTAGAAYDLRERRVLREGRER